jgi:hypothetical protein
MVGPTAGDVDAAQGVRRRTIAEHAAAQTRQEPRRTQRCSIAKNTTHGDTAAQRVCIFKYRANRL